MMQYEPVIGLEVHAQLSTETKLFCSCKATYGGEPNTMICPTCAGLPGALPVLNEKAVQYAVMTAKALRCSVHERSVFARKNYFYPDLPKGYQITQYEMPIATCGSIDVDFEHGVRSVNIRRVHLEEDAGKSIHSAGGLTLIDLNRCGIPLLEIVSEPQLFCPREASQYMKRLRQILLYLGVSDVNMEEGSLRCDANVSVRFGAQGKLGTRTELKNLNSFRFLEKALSKEIERQRNLLERGARILPETLLWDEEKEEVRVMRVKEEEQDYRYFPEPDLIPLEIDSAFIREADEKLPELPLVRKKRFTEQYALSEKDSEVLTQSKSLADYFEEVVGYNVPAKMASDWIRVQVMAEIKKRGLCITDLPIGPSSLASLLELKERGRISMPAAKKVFSMMLEGAGEPMEIIAREGLARMDRSDELEKVIDQVLSDLAPLVRRYRKGKTALLDRFVGEVMKRTRRRADPENVRELFLKKLGVRK